MTKSEEILEKISSNWTFNPYTTKGIELRRIISDFLIQQDLNSVGGLIAELLGELEKAEENTGLLERAKKGE